MNKKIIITFILGVVILGMIWIYQSQFLPNAETHLQSNLQKNSNQLDFDLSQKTPIIKELTPKEVLKKAKPQNKETDCEVVAKDEFMDALMGEQSGVALTDASWGEGESEEERAVEKELHGMNDLLADRKKGGLSSSVVAGQQKKCLSKTKVSQLK